MQSETVIIMIVGLIAIGLIRLVIAMVGREFAADHPHVKSRPTEATPPDSDTLPAVTSQRPVRGTGRKSHLLYFPESATSSPADPELTEEPITGPITERAS